MLCFQLLQRCTPILLGAHYYYLKFYKSPPCQHEQTDYYLPSYLLGQRHTGHHLTLEIPDLPASATRESPSFSSFSAANLNRISSLSNRCLLTSARKTTPYE